MTSGKYPLIRGWGRKYSIYIKNKNPLEKKVKKCRWVKVVV